MALLPRRYAELFALPSVRTLVAGGFAGRLAFGFYSLVFILVVHDKTGSFADAGAVTAAFSLGCGMAPLCARAIDRYGPRVLLALAAGHALAVLAIFALLLDGAPLVALIPCTWLAGLFLPPVGPVMRSIWRAKLRDAGLLTAAISLESVTMETVWLVGPLLVAVATATGALLGLLLLGPLLMVVGATTVVVIGGRHIGVEERPSGGEGGLLGALRARDVLLLVANMMPLGVGLGCVEVGIAAFANARLGAAYAGVLLATLSIGGITCGLAYGARAQQRRLRTRFLWLALAVATWCGLLTVVHWIPAVVALLIAFGGSFAVMLVVSNQLIGEIALPGTVTEAYTWQTGLVQTGVATGTSIAGLAVEAGGAGAGFAAAALAMFVGASGAGYLLRRARTTPQAAPSASGASVPIDGT